jgi:pyruvate,water dikinase
VVDTVAFTRSTCGEGGAVLALSDATNPECAGAKASALARATVAGLRALSGFVLTPDAADRVAASLPSESLADVRRAGKSLSADGARALVVRSSSTVEDGESSSMAGRFTSVLDVRGWDSFVDAVREVVASGAAVHAGLPEPGRMAVLVQPFVDPAAGGVLFGADPVSGRRDRLVLAAVAGGPDQLVSGEVDGIQATLTARGRVLDSSGEIPVLGRRALHALAALAHDAAAVFGGPQDIVWALVDDEVVLLQSRPITAATVRVDAKAPVYGPGPVAETFPAPLAPLEQDLWLDPLRDAMREVLRLTAISSRRRLAASPLLIAVDGRVAVDLELLGDSAGGRKRSFWSRLDPRPGARRLGAAWRVGRLRAALPALARDVVDEIDEQLAGVPDLDDLRDDELLTLLARSQQALVSAHGYEMLAGQLLSSGDAAVTAAGTALRVLARERNTDATAEELIARHPVLLALVPPAIGAPPTLPAAPRVTTAAVDVDDDALLREALRLRARWLHELTARAAMTLGRRLHRAGLLPDLVTLRALRFDELRALLESGRAIERRRDVVVDATPLPARFRLADDGTPVPVHVERATGDGVGRGAGGGRGEGVVQPADTLPADGAVLVVRTLDPGLAPMLPGLRGLVAETGSVLSHLAILAREFGIPTVVGVEDAVRRFPPGTAVVVDGASGEVAVADGGATEEVAA